MTEGKKSNSIVLLDGWSSTKTPPCVKVPGGCFSIFMLPTQCPYGLSLEHVGHGSRLLTKSQIDLQEGFYRLRIPDEVDVPEGFQVFLLPKVEGHGKPKNYADDWGMPGLDGQLKHCAGAWRVTDTESGNTFDVTPDLAEDLKILFRGHWVRPTVEWLNNNRANITIDGVLLGGPPAEWFKFFENCPARLPYMPPSN